MSFAVRMQTAENLSGLSNVQQWTHVQSAKKTEEVDEQVVEVRRVKRIQKLANVLCPDFYLIQPIRHISLVVDILLYCTGP